MKYSQTPEKLLLDNEPQGEESKQRPTDQELTLKKKVMLLIIIGLTHL
jgi:hypothetical protein